ncbi:hypothetical protein Tco_0462680 [Tanacetum coccineum]
MKVTDLQSEFQIFSDIPHTDAEIVSPLDVHVHHEGPLELKHPLFYTIPVFSIPKSTRYSQNIYSTSYTLHSQQDKKHSYTKYKLQPTPPPIIEMQIPLSNLLISHLVFQFNDRITALEKEVAYLKKDPLHTQVTSLVDSHLDTRSAASDSAPGSVRTSPTVIEKIDKESRDELLQRKVRSQPQTTYRAASTLTEFELKKILLDKIETSESYLMAPEHRDCYDGLKISYSLDKDFFYSYDVYSVEGVPKRQDKYEDLSLDHTEGIWVIIKNETKDDTSLLDVTGEIKVTKPDTTRPDIRKRNSYTLYKDPQGFIYVDDIGRNMLMRSDELYKFSNGMLTRLLSSLEYITKNIDMTYLPKRRWSNLEKKRAHFMIKDINKLLKERRMMRCLEKFVGEHAEFDESDTYVLERFYTTAGNPVKEILLKLNLPDHRSILTDSKEYLKMVMEREEINDKMAEMFGLLKEFTTSRAPEKVEERNNDNDVVTGDDIKKTTETETEVLVKEAETKNGAENKTKNKLIKKVEKEETVEAPSSQPVAYYMKHRINEKQIEGLVDNHRLRNHILDIKKNKKRSFILGTPFLTTAIAMIKFDKGTITLRSGKSKISFNRIPESLCKDEKGIKNDIEPIAPTMTVNRLVLEWEEKIKLHQEKEMEFDR